MGTTLAMVIGLLTPSADASTATYHAQEATPQVSKVSFTTRRTRHSHAWAIAADHEIDGAPTERMPEEIPHPTQPRVLNEEVVVDGEIIDGHYDGAPGDCEECGNEGCCGKNRRCCKGHLPCSWRARCNLPQHQPYDASPKSYFYFRAYTYIHTPAIQEEAVLHGAPRANPYDTRLFAGVYEELSRELKAAGAGTPPATPEDAR